MTDYPNGDLLVTPRALADRLKRQETLLVLDLRTPDVFAQGHVPTAIHIDLWGVSLIDTDPAPLRAFMWMIDHVLNLHGVDSAIPVIVYDEQSGIRAARAFWFLEYFGHPGVQLMDGGFDAWMRAGLPVTRDANPAPKSTWSGTPRPERIATWQDVRERLSTRDVAIVDTRTDGEYYGTLVRARRAGAIPGAVHIEWTNNLTPEGMFKPAAELRAMYESAGITPDKEIITYCQGGYRAAHAYLALRLLGYPRVRNYTGSWKEWGDREDLPIERPRRD